VIAETLLTGEARLTNTAYLVYVALDPEGRKTTVPAVEYVGDDQVLRARQAVDRQEFRKRQRAHEKRSS
jgi:acyl-CoA hydrolase